VVQTLVGRQPIFDRDLAVRGYELLFRDIDVPIVLVETSDDGHITPEKLLGRATDGIGALVGMKRAFCRVNGDLITGRAAILVPPDRLVLIVPPSLIRDEADLDGCRRLIDDGHTLAIDDFGGSEGAGQLLELASIVKIDVESMAREQAQMLVQECRPFQVEVIAENVHTRATLGRCEALGFDYFQGYLLSRPNAALSGLPAPGRLAGLRVAAQLLDAEGPISVIENIVRGDPAMSHQLLKMAGSGAAGGMRRTVTTIRQALVLMGWRRLQSWVALLLLTDDATISDEGIAAVLMRARMCELLAASAGCPPDAGYTAGLLSALDIVMGLPREAIVEALPLDTELHDAVISGDGPLGRLVDDVVDYQLGDPERARRSAIPEYALRAAAVEALTWSVGMTAVLESEGPG